MMTYIMLDVFWFPKRNFFHDAQHASRGYHVGGGMFSIAQP